MNLKKLKTAQLWVLTNAHCKPFLFQLAALHQQLRQLRALVCQALDCLRLPFKLSLA
jgi:hypothetical protein